MIFIAGYGGIYNRRGGDIVLKAYHEAYQQLRGKFDEGTEDGIALLVSVRISPVRLLLMVGLSLARGRTAFLT